MSLLARKAAPDGYGVRISIREDWDHQLEIRNKKRRTYGVLLLIEDEGSDFPLTFANTTTNSTLTVSTGGRKQKTLR